MRFKLGTTHYQNFPERFANNKNKRPIPMLELWFSDAERLRISRDGFIMPKVEEMKELLKSFKQAVNGLDDVNAIKIELVKYV